MENWRPVTGYEGLYEVSDNGKVRTLGRSRTDGVRLPIKLLKPLLRKRDGYVVVTIYKDGKAKCAKVHRLVAEAFIGSPPPDFVPDHRDGDRANNNVSNLHYVSVSRNNREVHKARSATGAVGVFHTNQKSKPPFRVYVTVDYRKKFLGYFDDIASASEARALFLRRLNLAAVL